MSSESCESYEVLYYKRSNKVHKSKGVSKADGLVTIDGALGKVSLYNNNNEEEDHEDTNKPGLAVVASAVNKELCKRPLEEDQTFVLGGWEVQVVARRGGENRATPAAAAAAAVKSAPWKAAQGLAVTKPISNPLKRKMVLQSRPLSVKQPMGTVPLVRKQGAGALAAGNTTTTSTTLTQQSSHSQSRVIPPIYKTTTVTGTLQSRTNCKPIRSSQGAAGLISRQPLRSQTSLLGRKRGLVATTTAKTTTTTATSIGNKTTSSQSKQPVASMILPHIPLPATLVQTLRPHQITGVDFLWTALLGDKKGAILADEMGLGKTLMTIAVCAAMHRQDRTKQFVIVCPSSLVNNWANEFDKWIGKAGSPKRVVIKKGGEEGLAQIKAYCSKMKQHSTQNGQVLIISYDLLRMKAAEQFQTMAAQQTSFKLLVVDEGHRLKNTTGSLTLTALQSIQCDARLCITATPIQNNLSEFYTIANFCCPGCLGDLPSFRRNFERPIAASSGSKATVQQRHYGIMQAKELDKITQTFMLRRLQKDILKSLLPPRCEALLFCRLSVEQCAMYRVITEQDDETQSTTGSMEESAATTADALTKLTALRKVCLHPSLCGQVGEDTTTTTNMDGGSLAQSGKLIVLDAILMSIRAHAPNDKVVLVSNFTSALSVVEDLVLRPRNLTFARLDGTTDIQNRQALVDSFNRASPEHTFCLLLSSKAGGVGLNLIGANRLIMLDADWNPALDIQAMGRVYRQGQTKPTFIYRLFSSGTIEEVIYQRQSAKGNLSDMAVDGKRSSSSKGFTKEELADCFTLKEHCNCDTKRKLGSRWPDYHGPSSLEESTTDAVLLDVAESMKGHVGHIHIVQHEEESPLIATNNSGTNDDDSVIENNALYDSDEEEEMEFE